MSGSSLLLTKLHKELKMQMESIKKCRTQTYIILILTATSIFSTLKIFVYSYVHCTALRSLNEICATYGAEFGVKGR
jgi:hypothetical protein